MFIDQKKDQSFSIINLETKNFRNRLRLFGFFQKWIEKGTQIFNICHHYCTWNITFFYNKNNMERIQFWYGILYQRSVCHLIYLFNSLIKRATFNIKIFYRKSNHKNYLEDFFYIMTSFCIFNNCLMNLSGFHTSCSYVAFRFRKFSTEIDELDFMKVTKCSVKQNQILLNLKKQYLQLFTKHEEVLKTIKQIEAFYGAGICIDFITASIDITISAILTLKVGSNLLKLYSFSTNNINWKKITVYFQDSFPI